MVFEIPSHFELGIEELVDMFEGNVRGCGTAFRWHVGGVGEGEGEEAAEASVAHVVGAWEVSGAGDGVFG